MTVQNWIIINMKTITIEANMYLLGMKLEMVLLTWICLILRRKQGI